MKPSNLVRFYGLRLRARLVQELFAVLGIAVGVALLFASQVANTSLSGSVDQLTSGLVGLARLQLAARDPHGFDERMLGEVQRLRGVFRAAPVLDVNADLVGPSGRRAVDFVGTDPRFVHLGGDLVRRFNAVQLSHQHALGLPAPLAQAVGAATFSTVMLQVGASSTPALVGAVLQPADIGALVHSPVVVAPLAYAQVLAGLRGRITRVLVEPLPGRDGEVQRELTQLAGGGINVRPADFDARVFAQAEGPNTQSSELFSVLSALVGFLFAFNAMLLTAPQRRGLVADLRLDGYTRREIVEVLLFDAFVLGVAGSLVGLLLGDLLSRGLLHAEPGYLAFAFPVGSQRIVTWECVVIAVGGGMLAACIGVLNPLRDIFARRPPTSTTPRASAQLNPAWLLGGGLACLAITTAVVLSGTESVQVAVLGFASLLGALLLLLPLLLTGALAVFDRLQQPFVGASPHLALAELRSSSTRARSLAIAATGAIAVFGSVAIEGAQRNLQGGLSRAARQLNLVTSLWVAPSGIASTLATIPFQSHAGGTLARLPGVSSVSIYRGAFLNVGDHRALVVAPPPTGIEPIPPTQLLSGDLQSATAEIRGHGWVTVSRTIASAYHLRVGQPFTLPAPYPMTLRVAAITTNFGWPPGAIVLNAEDYARAWGSEDPSAYQVALKPGVPPQRGQREVQQALGRGSALVVQTAQQREENDRATQRQGLARLSQISTLVLIAAILAMAAAMGTMIWQRRPRLAAMKVDGFDRGELWRALLYESALLLGTGCSIGAVFGLYGQLLLSHALVSVTGFPVVFSVGVTVAIASFTLVTAIAVAIVAVPGYLAARVRPALQE